MKFLAKMANALVLSSLLWLNPSYATVHALTSCSQLEAPKTVLLVHAHWCPHCRHYLPIYTAASNSSEMEGYKFYEKSIGRGESVCGHAIRNIPVTFKHDMKSKVIGEMSESQLIRFAKG